jgi:hypothetical protein
MGWFKKLVQDIHDRGAKIDPIGTYVKKQTAKIPGSHAALEEGIYQGTIGEASWDPYAKNDQGGTEIAVGDIWGGGTNESKKPEKRQYGRAIGTAIGSYFAAGALSGATSSGSVAATSNVGEGAAYWDAGAGMYVDSATGAGLGSTAPAGYTIEGVAATSGEAVTVSYDSAAYKASADVAEQGMADSVAGNTGGASANTSWFQTAKQVASGASTVSSIVKAANGKGGTVSNGTIQQGANYPQGLQFGSGTVAATPAQKAIIADSEASTGDNTNVILLTVAGIALVIFIAGVKRHG